MSVLSGSASALDIKFFEPDNKFIEWIINYADGRMIADIGCGTGHLLSLLMDKGIKCFGVEPYWDTKMTSERISSGKAMIQVIPTFVQKTDILKAANNPLILVCRPCHSGFHHEIAECAPEDAEILYIGLERNLEIDGVDNYPVIPHKGSSKENEIVIKIQ